MRQRLKIHGCWLAIFITWTIYCSFTIQGQSRPHNEPSLSIHFSQDAIDWIENELAGLEFPFRFKASLPVVIPAVGKSAPHECKNLTFEPDMQATASVRSLSITPGDYRLTATLETSRIFLDGPTELKGTPSDLLCAGAYVWLKQAKKSQVTFSNSKIQLAATMGGDLKVRDAKTEIHDPGETEYTLINNDDQRMVLPPDWEKGIMNISQQILERGVSRLINERVVPAINKIRSRSLALPLITDGLSFETRFLYNQTATIDSLGITFPMAMRLRGHAREGHLHESLCPRRKKHTNMNSRDLAQLADPDFGETAPGAISIAISRPSVNSIMNDLHADGLNCLTLGTPLSNLFGKLSKNQIPGEWITKLIAKEAPRLAPNSSDDPPHILRTAPFHARIASYIFIEDREVPALPPIDPTSGSLTAFLNLENPDHISLTLDSLSRDLKIELANHPEAENAFAANFPIADFTRNLNESILPVLWEALQDRAVMPRKIDFGPMHVYIEDIRQGDDHIYFDVGPGGLRDWMRSTFAHSAQSEDAV